MWSTFLDYARYSGDKDRYVGVLTALNLMSRGNTDFLPSPPSDVLNNDDVRAWVLHCRPDACRPKWRCRHRHRPHDRN